MTVSSSRAVCSSSQEDRGFPRRVKRMRVLLPGAVQRMVVVFPRLVKRMVVMFPRTE